MLFNIAQVGWRPLERAGEDNRASKDSSDSSSSRVGNRRVWVVFFCSFCFLDFSCRSAFITLTYSANNLFFYIPFLVFKFSIEGLRDILGVASILKLASPSWPPCHAHAWSWVSVDSTARYPSHSNGVQKSHVTIHQRQK